MTEQEYCEQLKEYDFSSVLINGREAPEYPPELEKNAYYGFYLLVRCASDLLPAAAGTKHADQMKRDEQLKELALSYLESEKNGKNALFTKNKPYTYRLVSLLIDFIALRSMPAGRADYLAFSDKMNDLVKNIEVTRTSRNPIRTMDIVIAKKWCRIFRCFLFLRMPDDLKPSNFNVEHDLTVSARRGISPEPLVHIDFRARFKKYKRQEKVGKLILLAEEWEMKCGRSLIQADPFMYEIYVLKILDTEAFYKIGLEWVSMLILRYPENHVFLRWKARYLRQDGKMSEAHEICDYLLGLQPADSELLCFKSNLCFLDGDLKLAREFGTKAVLSDAGDPFSHLTLAYAYLYDGENGEAVTSFNRALDLDPSLIDAYRGKGKALLMDDRAYDAMECLITVSRLSPEDPEIYHDLADVYFMCGYLEECKKYCRKCLALDPECAGAFVLLGMLEIRKNREEHAGKFLNRALEIEPKNPIALNELAYVQHLKGNDEECLRLLKKAIDIAPDFPDVLCSMGVVYYYQSEFDEALGYFDRTLDLDPYHVGAMLGKGNLYLAQSEAQEALEWYDKALFLDPEYPEAIQGIISAYRALGLEQDAFEWIQKASDLGIDPED